MNIRGSKAVDMAKMPHILTTDLREGERNNANEGLRQMEAL
jgi:hypothetical protein